MIERAAIVSAEPIMRLNRDLTPVTGAKSAEDEGTHSPQSCHIYPESVEASSP